MKDQTIFQNIDMEFRVFGITLDELIPIVLIFGLFMLCKAPLIGMILAACWFFAIRRVKKGLGAKYLMALVYWYIPGIKIKNSYEIAGAMLCWAFFVGFGHPILGVISAVLTFVLLVIATEAGILKVPHGDNYLLLRKKLPPAELIHWI